MSQLEYLSLELPEDTEGNDDNFDGYYGTRSAASARRAAADVMKQLGIKTGEGDTY